MGSSYKLFGIYWDNKPVSGMDMDIEMLRENDKFINVSDILQSDKPHTYSWDANNQTILLLDYFPSNKSSAIWDFYVKRVLQIAKYYQVSKICCASQSEIDHIKRITMGISKTKKHRTNCWRNDSELLR